MGLADAWNGHHRFVLGIDPDERPVGRDEALNLDRRLRDWQRSGAWEGDGHG